SPSRRRCCSGRIRLSSKPELAFHLCHTWATRPREAWMTQRADRWDRRKFLRDVACAATAGAAGLRPQRVLAEPPPETTRIRLIQFVSTCQAPLYLSGALLRTEGFTDVQWVRSDLVSVSKLLAAGTVDLGMNFVGPNIMGLEAGDPAIILAGGHVGCFELVGTDRVRSVRDLKGKAVAALGSAEHVFLSAMAAHVGLDPRRDINWVTHPTADPVALLTEGQIDAFMAFPPRTQELRGKRIGHVVVNSAVDRPWAQYFCCLIIGHREFVQKHPVATKRAMRAILKTADLCALEPERAAHSLVDKGFAAHYEYAAQLMRDLPYGKW